MRSQFELLLNSEEKHQNMAKINSSGNTTENSNSGWIYLHFFKWKVIKCERLSGRKAVFHIL